MNTPLDHGSEDLRYGEYVLGVLDADAHMAVEGEIAADHHAAEVARWQRYLMPLAEDIPDSVPPGHVWARIQDRIGQTQPIPRTATARERRGWWNNLTLWRTFAFGAAAVAAACVVALIVLPRGLNNRLGRHSHTWRPPSSRPTARWVGRRRWTSPMRA